MDAEKNGVANNHILVVLILDHLTSKELLPIRLASKLWNNEASALIRRRQEKFFFSPNTKTKPGVGWEDNVNGWSNALQISFIYSPRRDTFIRASRRFIDLESRSLNLEPATLQSALLQETDDFLYGVIPTPGSFPPNFTCKMAGHTLDHFTDFLESSNSLKAENSFSAHLSFRFDSLEESLKDRPETCRFFRVMSSKIRYLTMDAEEMCQKPCDFSEPRKWDHRYKIWGKVLQLQVLTLARTTHWGSRIHRRFPTFYVDSVQNAPPEHVPDFQGQGADPSPFLHLKCLRIATRKLSGMCTGWILSRARGVENVIFEREFGTRNLPFLGDFNSIFNPNLDLDLTPLMPFLIHPRRLNMHLTSLFISVYQDSPQIVKLIAKLVTLQQSDKQKTQVKNLHLVLQEPPIIHPAHCSPYSTSIVPPLLQLLKTVAPFLESMTLSSGAAVFLEGLIQTNIHDHSEAEPSLKSFPSVRTLILQPGSFDGNLTRRDFFIHPQNNLDPNSGTSPSVTALSTVFPILEGMTLQGPVGQERAEEWCAFMARPDLFFDRPYNPGPGPGSLQPGEVTEVESVKKLKLEFSSFSGALCVWNFSNVKTLELPFGHLPTLGSTVWSLSSLRILDIDGLDFGGPWGQGETQSLEATLSGLSIEVINEWADNLKRTLPSLSIAERDSYLLDKKTAFRALIPGPSIFDLGQLGQLKLRFAAMDLEENLRKIVGGSQGQLFSPVGCLLIFDLLPPSCDLAILVKEIGNSLTPSVSHELLGEAFFGSAVYSNPRVTLTAIRDLEVYSID